MKRCFETLIQINNLYVTDRASSWKIVHIVILVLMGVYSLLIKDRHQLNNDISHIVLPSTILRDNVISCKKGISQN